MCHFEYHKPPARRPTALSDRLGPALGEVGCERFTRVELCHMFTTRSPSGGLCHAMAPSSTLGLNRSNSVTVKECSRVWLSAGGNQIVVRLRTQSAHELGHTRSHPENPLGRKPERCSALPQASKLCRTQPHSAAICRTLPHSAALCCTLLHSAALC